MIYTHVLNRGGKGVPSPLDQICEERRPYSCEAEPSSGSTGLRVAV